MGNKIIITEKQKQMLFSKMKNKQEVDEILWDDANKKALSTWYRDSERKIYKFEINEPCVIEVNEEEHYHVLKFLLMKNRIKYNLKEK